MTEVWIKGGLVALLSVYTLIALIVNWRNALPLFLFELFVSCWILCKYLLRKHASAWRSFWTLAEEQTCLRRGRRSLAVGAVLLFHLMVLLALGTRTGQQWCAVVGLGAIVLVCYFASVDRHAVRWRPEWALARAEWS